MSKELLNLADEIETLIKEGNTDRSEGSPMEKKRYLAKRLVEASFGKGTKEYKSYKSCPTENLPALIRHLTGMEEARRSKSKGVSMEVNFQQSQTQSQNTKVTTEIVNQIHLNIDQSALSNTEKEEAKELVEQVRGEVAKPQANWDKVTNLLKKSFDYGLPVASGLMKLADLYSQFKGLS